MGAARLAAESAVHLAPDDPDCHNLLAVIALEAKQWKEGERHCRRALELDPENWQAMNNLGVALSHQRRRRREAVECFTHAARLDPKEDVSRHNLWRTSWAYVYGALLTIVVFLLLRGAAVVAVAVVAFYFLYLRPRRLRKLSPTVVSFLRDERRRKRRQRWERVRRLLRRR